MLLARVAAAAVFVPLLADAMQGGTLPNWTPTYLMNSSTIVQPCNSSGFFNSEYLSVFVYSLNGCRAWTSIACSLLIDRTSAF